MRQFVLDRARSFRFAWEGISYVFRTQRNAQIHLVIIVIVLFLTVWLALPFEEIALIFLTIGVVLGAEFFNTAMETLVDMVSPDHHPLAKIAKDVCAGAVLICAVSAVLVGIALFAPPLLNKLNLIPH
jgi:undecaprenol kinase/diacylglycerol kinase (ATP)